MKKITFLLLTIIVMTISSCKKEPVVNPTPTTPVDTDIPTISIEGKWELISQDGISIEDKYSNHINGEKFKAYIYFDAKSFDFATTTHKIYKGTYYGEHSKIDESTSPDTVLDEIITTETKDFDITYYVPDGEFTKLWEWEIDELTDTELRISNTIYQYSAPDIHNTRYYQKR